MKNRICQGFWNSDWILEFQNIFPKLNASCCPIIFFSSEPYFWCDFFFRNSRKLDLSNMSRVCWTLKLRNHFKSETMASLSHNSYQFWLDTLNFIVFFFQKLKNRISRQYEMLSEFRKFEIVSNLEYKLFWVEWYRFPVSNNYFDEQILNKMQNMFVKNWEISSKFRKFKII